MQRPLQRLAILAGLAVAAACSKPAPQQQSHATAPTGVQWVVIVQYNQPKDTAAFEKYYAEKHVTRGWPRRVSRPSPATYRYTPPAATRCSWGRRRTSPGAYRDSRRAAGGLAHRPTLPRAGGAGP